MAEGIGEANLCSMMRSKMSVIKSKMGTIKSKIGRKFEQKRKAKWVKEKANLVKAYESLKLLTHSTLSAKYTCSITCCCTCKS